MPRNRTILSLVFLFLSLIMLHVTAEAAAPQKNTATPNPAVSSKHEPAVENNATFMKVRRLQRLLADTGFYPGQVTGMLDSTTKEAISRAQKSCKLEQTGTYDPELVNLLAQEASSKPCTYRQKLVMEATAYTSQDPGCGNLTKREHRLRKGLVAVDPRVIPLGTRLYAEGYGYAIADDIGSAIKGAKIDLAYENRKDAFIFGRQMITVFVLD